MKSFEEEYPVSRLLRYGTALLGVLFLSSCSIQVDSASLLRADDKVQPLDMTSLDPVREIELSGARLEPFKIRHGDGVVSHGVYLSRPDSKVVIVYLTGNSLTYDLTVETYRHFLEQL